MSKGLFAKVLNASSFFITPKPTLNITVLQTIGLVGGSVPVHNEVILSTEKLNKIYNFDEINGILSCGSGCILQDLQDKIASTWSHLVPIDLGAKGSCMIGGNVSTNAGKRKTFRIVIVHFKKTTSICLIQFL